MACLRFSFCCCAVAFGQKTLPGGCFATTPAALPLPSACTLLGSSYLYPLLHTCTPACLHPPPYTGTWDASAHGRLLPARRLRKTLHMPEFVTHVRGISGMALHTFLPRYLPTTQGPLLPISSHYFLPSFSLLCSLAWTAFALFSFLCLLPPFPTLNAGGTTTCLLRRCTCACCPGSAAGAAPSTTFI